MEKKSGGDASAANCTKGKNKSNTQIPCNPSKKDAQNNEEGAGPSVSKREKERTLIFVREEEGKSLLCAHFSSGIEANGEP